MTENTFHMASAKSIAVNKENPWPGLLAYGEADREFFHGRQVESDELLRLVLRDSLAILFGSSGLGKSSLIQAGLFPQLRQQNILPIYIRLDYSEDRPKLTAQIKEAIVSAAATVNAEAPVIKENETLWECFHRKDADFWSHQNRILLPPLASVQYCL